MNARNEREANAEMGRCPPCTGNCYQGRDCPYVRSLYYRRAAPVPERVTQPMVFAGEPTPDSDYPDSEGSETDAKPSTAVKVLTLVLVVIIIGAVLAIMGDSLVRIATRGLPW